MSKGAVVVKFKEVAYQVQGFKAFNPTKKEESGVMRAYFYIKASEENEEANLNVSWKTYQDLHIPVLENSKQIEKQAPLLKGKEACAAPPAKKARKTT